MPLPITWLVQQTTNTSGTGTFTLNAAAAERRSWQVGLGASSIVSAYRAVTPGTSNFEVGIGTFNGGSPGTLTRSTVLASSNAGSLVSFSGVSDLIPVMLPGQRPRLNVTGSGTEALVDLGSIIAFTGSAAATRTLPAAASVPPWSGYLYTNQGSAGAWLILDGNGSETINGLTTLTLFAGESVELFSTGTAWFATVLPAVSLVRRQVASASAQIDFVLPSGFEDFVVEFRGVVPATDGAVLALRTSVDSGATFAAGAANYTAARREDRPGTSSVLVTHSDASAIPLTSAIDTGVSGGSAAGRAQFHIGSASIRPQLRVTSGCIDNATALYGSFDATGVRGANAAVNAIRLLMDTGNISVGTFALYAVR